MMYDDYNQLGVQADLNANFDYWLNDAITQDEYEGMIFFYHKDLPKAFGMGSSTQISDPGANIIQHIEYLPYGETFFERRDYWNTPYKFNAKELDAETGMYYYGARYYTPEVSIWLSVDPLADKYPSMSPYMYCAGNPVVFIDPNGMEIDNIGDGIKNFFKGVGNLLRGRGWNANHKTRLVKNQDSKEDVMNARFRDGDFVGWVSNSYLNKLASKTGDNFQDLLAKITNELSYSPPAQSPISYKSYEDVVKHYQSELSHTTSMKAPTVKRITGQASLSYTGLTPNYRFDIDNQKNKWSYFGSPPGIIRDFNLSRKNIVTTSFSRLQPGFGNANTPAKGDLFHLNGAFYHFEVIATPFSYSLSVPVKR
jgi:RHS repeat-associated protein